MCLAVLATLTGLEPATSAVTGRRANQLRHGAIFKLLFQLCTLPGARETIAQHLDQAVNGRIGCASGTEGW